MILEFNIIILLNIKLKNKNYLFKIFYSKNWSTSKSLLHDDWPELSGSVHN